MIIDVNSERCLFIDQYNRQYSISPEVGHHYDGNPFRLVDAEQIVLSVSGSTFVISPQDYSYRLGKGSIGHDSASMTSLHFKVWVPDSDEELKYTWVADLQTTSEIRPEKV